jgi:hypothetical protein
MSRNHFSSSPLTALLTKHLNTIANMNSINEANTPNDDQDDMSEFDEAEMYSPDLVAIATHGFRFAGLEVMYQLCLLRRAIDLRFEMANTMPVNVEEFDQLSDAIWYNMVEIGRQIWHIQDPVQRYMLATTYQRLIGTTPTEAYL